MTTTSNSDVAAVAKYPGDYPAPGHGRFWLLGHDPKKPLKPLRIELRQKNSPETDAIRPTFSRLLSHDNCIAKIEARNATMEAILERVEDIDKLTGIFA